MTAGELEIIPIGGCHDVGMNATLIACGRRALIVDCGTGFGAADFGVERHMPDLWSVLEAGYEIEAVVLTHGHEDHIGSLPGAMALADFPIYGLPFTLSLVESRIEDRMEGAAGRWLARLHRVDYRRPESIGPFSVEWVHVTHSIPQSAALVIQAAGQTVVHSGDFRLDQGPVDGLKTDLERLHAVGDAGVDLLLSDSTNSERCGALPSEDRVATGLKEVVASAAQRVFVGVFASHLHRVQSVFDAARASGRRVAVAGRRLEENIRLASDLGVITPTADVWVQRGWERLPRAQTVVLTSGVQAEPRSGLQRFADSGFLGASDRVVFSGRVIPGRERDVRALKNRLAQARAEIFDDARATVHCSGHAMRDEQVALLKALRPRAFVPIHGDFMMRKAHAATARAEGVPPEHIILLDNGDRGILRAGSFCRGPSMSLEARVIARTGHPLTTATLAERARFARAGAICVRSPVDGASGIVLDGMALALPDSEWRKRLEAALGPHLRAPPPTEKIHAMVVREVGRLWRQMRWGAAPQVYVDAAGSPDEGWS